MDALAPRSERLRQFVAVDPGNAALRLSFFDALMEEGRHEQAVQVAEQAMQVAGADARADAGWCYRLGVAQARAGLWPQADQTLSALVQATTHVAPALWHELAMVKLRCGADDAAVALLQAATEDAEHIAQLPGAELQLLRTLHRLGRLTEGLALGQRALQRRPHHGGLRAALATLCLDADRSDLLPDLLAQAPDAAELAPMAQAELASAQGYLALQQDDLAAATEQFGRSLQAVPDLARSRLGLGLALAAQGQVADAEAQLQQATAGMASHLGSWHALAWLQLARGDLDAAEATFRHVLALDDTFAESHGGLAVVAALRGDATAARELVRVALRLDRESANAMAAQLVLRHGSLQSPELMRDALALLARRPGLHLPARLRGNP